MSVPIPTVEINVSPLPQFTPRSRREEDTRDLHNARNIEVWQASVPIQQAFFRPEPSTAGFGGRKDASYNDQAGIASRNQPPISLPAPQFDPAGPKLVGNVFFDQHAPEYDPRNVVRELRGAVKEDKTDRGYIESQRLLNRGFSSRYVPEGFAETRQLDSLQAFEMLRPKIDDLNRDYRKYN
jgi:hypothetical protein